MHRFALTIQIYFPLTSKAKVAKFHYIFTINISTHLNNISGPLSIAVPGELLGYWEMHKRFGTMSWTDILRPTIELCERGFVMTKHMADFLNPRFKDDANLRFMFVDSNNGEFFMAGTVIRPAPNLCQTYRLIAQNGGGDFYNGTLASLVLADLQQIGSIINEDDLKQFRVAWTESTAVPLGKDTMYVTPPPSSGQIVAFIMNVLKGFESNDSSPRAALTPHRIVEAFKFAFAKHAQLCDPDFCDINDLMQNLTSASYADEIRRQIDDITFSSYSHYGAKQLDEVSPHGTSHISIIAPNGDAVSVTSSINY